MPDYRDAARLAERAYSKALTRVAVVPLTTSWATPVSAATWRTSGAIGSRSSWRPSIAFTRVLGGDAVEQAMSVSQLDG